VSEPNGDVQADVTPAWAVVLGLLATIGSFAPILAVIGAIVCIFVGRWRSWVIALSVLIVAWFLKEIAFSGDLISPEFARWLQSYWIPEPR
jgi:hypothetical protein